MEKLFDRDTHTYYVNGQKVPSVTELCKFLNYEAEYADKQQRDFAAHRGTVVHELTAILDYGESVEVPVDLLGYVQAWERFKRDYRFEVDYVERVVYGKRFAGTIDIIGRVDGNKPCIVDKKTGSKPQKNPLQAQLNGYKMLLRENGDETDYALLGVYLKKDGTYSVYQAPESEKIVETLYDLYEIENKNRKRWRKTI